MVHEVLAAAPARPAPDGLRPAPPRELQLEVTGSCNLRCKMCLVSYRPEIGKREGSLSFETFRKLVDDLPDLERITLQGLGEPLLAPDLLSMIRYATARGIEVGFNTNGMLLTERRAEDLVGAGLGWLHVSLDGATAETYEGIRGRSRFDKVAANVRSLMRVKKRRRSDLPRVSLVFVAMRRNLEELPALVEIAAEWGVGRLWVQNLSHSFSDTDPAGGYAGIRAFAAKEAIWQEADLELASKVFDEARDTAAARGVELRLPRLSERPAKARKPGQPGCAWPWTSAYVTHEGVVQPCCMVMGSDRVRLGDLRTSDFLQVWSSDEYARFREGLLSAGDPPAVCLGCSMYRGLF